MRPRPAGPFWPRTWARGSRALVAAFAPAPRQAGARAIFAFPLRIGAIRVGVLGLYRARPVRLSTFHLGRESFTSFLP